MIVRCGGSEGRITTFHKTDFLSVIVAVTLCNNCWGSFMLNVWYAAFCPSVLILFVFVHVFSNLYRRQHEAVPWEIVECTVTNTVIHPHLINVMVKSLKTESLICWYGGLYVKMEFRELQSDVDRDKLLSLFSKPDSTWPGDVGDSLSLN